MTQPAQNRDKTRDFYDMLASRILYQLERQGLIKMCGKTVDEVHANIAKARAIAVEMMLNGAKQ